MSCEQERLAFEQADQKARNDAQARDDAIAAANEATQAAQASLSAAAIAYNNWIQCRSS